MPVDYKKYPNNWKEIRAEILERAYHCCEALCQICHNRLDAPMGAKNAKKTRLATKHAGQIEIEL
jgi:uncharacterized protein YdaT